MVGPLVIALMVIAGGLVGGPHPAEARVTAVPSATLDLVGRGFGHGIGMSQYGAKARAEAGANYGTILSAYYPGTSLTIDNDDKPITVWVSDDDDNNETWVVAEPGMTLRTSNPDQSAVESAPVNLPDRVVGPGGALVVPTAWRLRLESLTFRLEGHYQGQWYTHGVPEIGDVLADVKRASLASADGTLRLIIGSQQIEHRGVVSANRTSNGSPATVSTTVTVSMGNYLRSVVPSEMPSSWHITASQAQAVAARTYATHDRDVASRPWWYDTCDTTACQVYRGAAVYDGTGTIIRSFEDARSTTAITQTASRILTYEGAPAFTQFSASNGGHSVQGTRPYLAAASDPFDTYPEWSASLTGAQIAAAYPTIGAFSSIAVTRDAKGPFGGRVVTVRVQGTAGAVEVSGAAFRSQFGLRSTLWAATTAGAGFSDGLHRDWNTDGLADLLARGPDGGLYYFRATGSAQWLPRVKVGHGWQGFSTLLATHNLAGAGKPEVVGVDRSGLLRLYVGSGTGVIASSRVIGKGWGGITAIIGARDWDRPGSVGLIARTRSGDLLYYGADGAGRLLPGRQIGRGWNGMDLITYAGDFDGDGNPDIIARNASSQVLMLYPGNGAGRFLEPRQIGRNWGAMDVLLSGADWDQDGNSDVLARDPASGLLRLYPGDSGGGFGVVRVVGSGWTGFDPVR